MRKTILAGAVLTALVAAMLSIPPATANELPGQSAVEPTMVASPVGEPNAVEPDAGESNAVEPGTVVLDAGQTQRLVRGTLEPSDAAKSPAAGDEPAVEPDTVKAKEPTVATTPPPTETVGESPPGGTPAVDPPPVVQTPEPPAAETTPDAPKPAPLPEKQPAPEKQAPALKAPATAKAEEKTAIAVTGAIATRWMSLKGEAGALGAPTAPAKKTADYTSQQFAGGIIYATTRYGVQHILKTSAIGKTWTANGEAAYGFPISGEITTAKGNYQQFSNNYWIFNNGFAIYTSGGVAKKWQENGGMNVMGMPKSMEKCGQRNNGCYQNFTKGTVFWSPATGAQAVWGGILSRYGVNGDTGNYLGYPTSKEMCGLIRSGCYQNFERGLIMWSAQTGAYSVATGAIRSYYGGTGTAKGYLGFPSSSESCDYRGCTQRFQGGTVYWSGLTGAQGIRNGKILNAFNDRKAYKGELGFPRANEVCGQPNGGCYQDFSNGRLWSNNGQTYGFRTNGGIGAAYYAKGGPRSNLGYALSDEKCSGGQCAQSFQGGFIGWGSGAGGTYSMSECQYLNDGRSRYSGEGSKHVLLTFTQYYGQSYATNVYCKNIAGVYVTEWRTDGYVGATGFKPPGVASGPTRNLFSPTGSFTVTEAFGLGNPGTALPYRTLNPNSRWGGNPWTPTYNQYHESSSWTGWDENMWYFAQRATRDYEQGAVINYNRPYNIVQDAGFAIFLHQNKVPTAGCISIDNWAMVDYLRKSVSGDRIIMGVHSALFK